jgi:tRNA (mo5U34)-methyltransferase
MPLCKDVPADFFADVHWHQRWEIFPGVFVPGRNPVDFICAAVQLPSDLTGKRVLDVGAWNGCFSFECERRGAAEVVAFSLEDPAEWGFDRLHRLLESRVRYVRGSIYTLTPADLGAFDVILFFGVLYHLRYPLLALDRLRGVCRGEVFIETHVIDEHAWLRPPLVWLSRLPLLRSALARTPIWRQYRDDELQPGDASNWFGPNTTAVVEAFESAGFTIAPTRAWGNRAAFRAHSVAIPTRLLDGSYEGWSPNRAIAGLPKIT